MQMTTILHTENARRLQEPHFGNILGRVGDRIDATSRPESTKTAYSYEITGILYTPFRTSINLTAIIDFYFSKHVC